MTAQGPPLVTHLDLRAAMAKQVQQLRFVGFEQWFPPRRDDRASEGFYTPLQEDFYNVYLNSGQSLDLRGCVTLSPL